MMIGKMLAQLAVLAGSSVSSKDHPPIRNPVLTALTVLVLGLSLQLAAAAAAVAAQSRRHRGIGRRRRATSP